MSKEHELPPYTKVKKEKQGIGYKSESPDLLSRLPFKTEQTGRKKE